MANTARKGGLLACPRYLHHNAQGLFDFSAPALGDITAPFFWNVVPFKR
ncbi:hypothetical protein BN2475_140054 [Paraburkholderia ribeironis]|uniref:Uncharacterized protein n=1 Tax=Paraburkholderia ribeironis TaxID=1247936 RepID=A0A1N7RSV9_9BURK|nr:hypothetical protein BN2475_140054 [Paraburkholderia ribeironis]